MEDWASCIGRAGEPRGREKSLSIAAEKVPVPTQKRRIAIPPCQKGVGSSIMFASRDWLSAASISGPIPAFESVLLEAGVRGACRIAPPPCQRSGGRGSPQTAALPKIDALNIVFQYY
jgi:hypothetical protein